MGLMTEVQFLAGEGILSSLPLCPDQFWGPPSLPSNRYQWLILWGTMADT